MRAELAAERARAYRRPSSTPMMPRAVVPMRPCAGPALRTRHTMAGESEQLMRGSHASVLEGSFCALAASPRYSVVELWRSRRIDPFASITVRGASTRRRVCLRIADL